MILQWTTLLTFATATFVTVQVLPYASLDNNSLAFISSLNKHRVVYSYHYSGDYSTAISTSYSFEFPQFSYGDSLKVPTIKGDNNNTPTTSFDASSAVSAASEETPRGKHCTSTITESPSTTTESTVTNESTLIIDGTTFPIDSSTSIDSTSSADTTSSTELTSIVDDTTFSPIDGASITDSTITADTTSSFGITADSISDSAEEAIITPSEDQSKPTPNSNKNLSKMILSKERQVISIMKKKLSRVMKNLSMERNLSSITQTLSSGVPNKV